MVTEILDLIYNMEDIHTEEQGMITTPNFTMPLLFGVSERWFQCINQRMVEYSSKDLIYPEVAVPSYLDRHLQDLDGGQYVGQILFDAFSELAS